MEMGRTCVNLIGKCLAAVVVARGEGEFDGARTKVSGSPEEAALDLKSEDIAFSEAGPAGTRMQAPRAGGRRADAFGTPYALLLVPCVF
jgi:hypothetical protein